MNPHSEGDALVDQVTGQILRAGVLLAALTLAVGGAMYLWHYGAKKTPDRSEFEPMPAKYSRVPEMFRAAAAGEARPLIGLGVVALIATPLLRVLFTAVAFAWRRDWLYVALPAVVLAVLGFGAWAGQAGG